MKKGKFLKNITSNIIAMFLGIIVNICLTPFIVNTLGADAYGFIPLIQQVVNYMTVITIAINSMEARFFTISSESGDHENAQKYISTTLISSIIISIALFIPLIIITMFINKIVNVPVKLINDVKLSILLCGFIFLLSNIASSYGVATFRNKRFDISSYINMFSQIVRAVSIIILFRLFTPNIWFVNLANLIGCILAFIANYYVFQYLEPNIKIAIKYFDLRKLFEILKSGLWMSINWIGSILFLQIDLIVSNWMLGPVIAGEYAVVLQFSNLMRTFASTIIPIFTPSIIAIYAKKDTKSLVKYSNRAVKITGLFMAIPIGLICGLGGSLLSLWINPHFKNYEYLLILMTIHLSVNLGVQPLFSLQTALNKVKIPAIVTIIMGIINFALAILLSGPVGLGAYGIALSGAIVLTSKNLIFTPIYSSIITKQPYTSYLKGIFKPLIVTTVVLLLGLFSQYLFIINNWYKLFIISIFIAIISIVFSFFLLEKEEKEYIYIFRKDTYSKTCYKNIKK